MVHENLVIKTLSDFKRKNLVDRYYIGINSYCSSQYIKSGTKITMEISRPRKHMCLNTWINTRIIFSIAKCIKHLFSTTAYFTEPKVFTLDCFSTLCSNTVTLLHPRQSLKIVFMAFKNVWLYYLSFVLYSDCWVMQFFDVHLW